MKKNLKRIGAILLILIIAGLYVWAIVAAVMARPEANGVFVAAAACTVLVPGILYIIVWFRKVLKKET